MRASESDRGLVCPASLVRPRTAPRSERADTTAAWGTLVHSWKEDGDPRGNKTLQKKLTASGIDRESLWPASGDSQVGHEATFSLHLESLSLRIWSSQGSKYSRDHWKRRHPKRDYLTGSIDWLSSVSRKGTPLIPWVDDLKTGTWPVSARTSLQLRSYALVPWVLNDCSTDVWLSITQWPKYRLDGKPKRNWYLCTSSTLAKHLQLIRWCNANTDIAIPTDDGCRFCPCRTSCPDYSDYVGNIESDDND